MVNGLWVQPEELGDLADTEFAYEAARTASYILWALSGRKYAGVQMVTERYGAHIVPKNMWKSQWYSTTIDSVREFAATVPPLSLVNTSIRLRGTPVNEIHSIRIADTGEVLNPDTYYVVNHSLLRFRSTLLQNIEVTYSYGFPPPIAGKMAARDMAINFARLWGGHEEDCTFPDRVQSVTRQGVSWVLLDNQDFIAQFRTGIYAVDLFLKATNPDNARARAKVFIPGATRAEKTTVKPLVLAASQFDLSTAISVTGDTTLDLSDINAEFLTGDPDIVPVVRLKSWGGSKIRDLNDDNIIPGSGTLTIEFPYDEVVSILGTQDPGTWDLLGYNESTDTYTYVLSGNLQIVPV